MARDKRKSSGVTGVSALVQPSPKLVRPSVSSTNENPRRGLPGVVNVAHAERDGLFQRPPHAGERIFVRALYVHEGAHSARIAHGRPVGDAVAVGRYKSRVFQKVVGTTDSVDIQLAVVARQHEIRLFQQTAFFQRPADEADVLIGFAQAVRHLRRIQPVLVPVVVDLRRMQEKQVGRVSAQDIGGALQHERVRLGVVPLAEPVVRGHDIAQKRLAGSRSGKRRAAGGKFPVRPDFVDEIIDIGVIAGARPEHRRRGVPCPMRERKQIGRLHRVVIPQPRYLLFARKIKRHIGHHAVPVRIHAGDHGDVTGVRDRRIDRRNVPDLRPTGQIPAEVGQRFQIRHIRVGQRVLGQYDEFGLFHGSLPAKRSAHTIPQTAAARQSLRRDLNETRKKSAVYRHKPRNLRDGSTGLAGAAEQADFLGHGRPYRLDPRGARL